MKPLCNFLFLIRLVSGSLLALLPLLFLLLSSFAYSESSGTPQSGERVESVIYPGDGTTEAEPEPPPSFSLNLAPAIEAKLPNTLSADELKRLRPRPDFTPLGVHRVLHDRVRLVEFGRNGRMIDRTQALTRQAEREAAGLITEPAQQQQINGLQNSNSNNKASSRDSNNKASTKDAATDRPNLRLPSPRSQAVPPHNVYSLVEGAWQTTAAGSLWRMQITAPAARALRLHFKNFNVGTGRVWIYASSQNSLKQKAYGPYTGQGIYDDGDFWSDIVFHNSLTIEYSPDPDRPHAKAVPFRIHKVSHLTRLPLATQLLDTSLAQLATQLRIATAVRPTTHVVWRGLIVMEVCTVVPILAMAEAYMTAMFLIMVGCHKAKRNARPPTTTAVMLSEMAASLVDIPQRNIVACHNDVKCYDEWSNSASGVGLVVISKGDGTAGQCSGALLNDKVDGSYIPYFLTAAHCVHTGAEARSVIVYWKYQNYFCNLETYRSYRVESSSRGATLLATTGHSKTKTFENLARGDSTLLRLRQNPPKGVRFLGWWARNLSPGEDIATIHHPTQKSARISFGSRHTSRPDLGHLSTITLTDGIIEGGSSGAPVLYKDDEGQYVVGVISAGEETACSGSYNASISKLGSFFSSIQRWLSPDASDDPPDDPPAGVLPTVTLAAYSSSGQWETRVSIESGKGVLLRWSSTNASRIKLTATTPKGSSDVEGVTQKSGYTALNPTIHTVYIMTATSSTGHTATASVAVLVTSAPTPVRPTDQTLRWVAMAGAHAQSRAHRVPGCLYMSQLIKNLHTHKIKLDYPTIHTVYIMTATSSTGHTATARVAVLVTSAPTPVRPTATLTASSNSIQSGQSVTLSWSSTKAERVSLKCSDSSDTYNVRKSDSWTTSRFTSTTICRITATSSTGHTDTDSVRIRVISLPDPQITSFTVSPTSITSGSKATFRWSTRNAQTVTFRCDSHQGTGLRFTNSNVSSGSWSRTVFTHPTTCHLTAINAAGRSVSKSVNVRVRTNVIPAITSFTASSTSITRGQSITLRWSSRNANHAIISWSGGSSVVSPSGSKTFSPTRTTRYHLTVTSTSGDQATKLITITVRNSSGTGQVVRPTVNLTASLYSVEREAEVKLRWSSTDARISRITAIYVDGARRPILQDAYWINDDGTPLSSYKVIPVATTTYRVTVTSRTGHTASDSVRIRVTTPTKASAIRPTINLTASSRSIQNGQSV